MNPERNGLLIVLGKEVADMRAVHTRHVAEIEQLRGQVDELRQALRQKRHRYLTELLAALIKQEE